MRKLSQFAVNFLKAEDGPTAVEYAVMLALIIVVCITAIGTLGSNAQGTFNYVANKVATGSQTFGATIARGSGLYSGKRRRIRYMLKLGRFALDFLKREDGPTAVEYAVMLALIIVVCITAIGTLGSNAQGTFNYVANNVATGS